MSLSRILSTKRHALGTKRHVEQPRAARAPCCLKKGDRSPGRPGVSRKAKETRGLPGFQPLVSDSPQRSSQDSSEAAARSVARALRGTRRNGRRRRSGRGWTSLSSSGVPLTMSMEDSHLARTVRFATAKRMRFRRHAAPLLAVLLAVPLAPLFAALLVSLGTGVDATADEARIEVARIEVIHGHEAAGRAVGVGGAAGSNGTIRSGRPAFAVLHAAVANWDGDLGPDGWFARVQVFDTSGRPMAFAGTASFELVPRVPADDLTRFVAAGGKRLRWTTVLTTDGDGGATVKLPLRRSLPQTPDGRVPFSGVMRVRLAVATAGVYEAESVVAINPPGLVDTLWEPR